MSNSQSKRDSPLPAALPQVGVFGKAKARNGEADTTLYHDALDAARSLKRKHRSDYQRDPKAFRSTVKKAHSHAYRLKPGPRPDPRIETAARARTRGTPWERLYPEYIEHYAAMSPFTRALAEDGFRRKVNSYLKRHPARRRRWQAETSKTKTR